MTPTLIFDIETIPDVSAGRKLLNLPEKSEDEVLQALIERRKAQTQGSEFLPHYLQQIVTISVVVKTQDWVKVWSLGDIDASEKELIERFFAGLDRYRPTLVSWNGSGFDLPVLHYRALLHGVAAPQYWDVGHKDPDFKWNNYLSRFHYRHIDLMDVLAGYQNRAFAPLDEITRMLGFPGKMGMGGNLVHDQYRRGELQEIRDYCETDVLNTYLVYLRFQLMRGLLNNEQYENELQILKDSLKASDKPHLHAFLEAWQS